MPYTLGDNVVARVFLPEQVGSSAQPTVVHASSVELGGSDLQSTLTAQSNALATKQLALDTPVVTSASGTGNLTLSSNTGYNTLLTYTPPDLSSFLTAVPSNVDATKIADGSVDNTEFQYLNGVTSSIQSQLNNTAVVYQNSKTLVSTGVTEFFSIPRNTAQGLIIELRIVAGSGGSAMLWHGITGVIFAASEIFILDTELRATSNFNGGGSAYVPSYVESPENAELDIRVQSNTGDTNFVRAYLNVWCSKTDPTVTLR